MPTVLGELRCGHITSVYSGKGCVGVSCFGEKCPAVVPCATADEESGSSLKLGSSGDQPFVLLSTTKLILEKCFLSNEPLHKILLSANQTLALSLIYPVHYILFIPPPWVWLDLLSTFVLTPFLNFYKGRPRLRSRGCWVGYRPAPSLACGFGSPAGDSAWRKTLMTFFLYLISLHVCGS